MTHNLPLMRLLFVCTGNICRSPLAERLAATLAEEALGASAATVLVRSAGTDALDGKGMDARSASALRKLGGDPEGFVARTFTPAMAYGADLVLTMTRQHRRLVLAQAPRAMKRTFTLPEAAALMADADLTGLRQLPLDQRAVELAVRLNEGRARRRPVEADDVFDPIGQSSGIHEQVAARIARKIQPLAELLFATEQAQVPLSAASSGPLRRPLPPIAPLRTA